MKRYITDGFHGICLDGIRVVTRADGYDSAFVINITFKGNHFSLKYPNRQQRDETFERIIEELEERNKKRDSTRLNESDK